MLKNILNLQEVNTLEKEQQRKITGGIQDSLPGECPGPNGTRVLNYHGCP